MKLLFDQNLSPRLVLLLADLFPNSAHVDPLGLGKAIDTVVWDYARQYDFMIVSKDADFSDLSVLRGFPPKVIWIRRRNCPTRDIATLIRFNYFAIQTLLSDPTRGILMLY